MRQTLISFIIIAFLTSCVSPHSLEEENAKMGFSQPVNHAEGPKIELRKLSLEEAELTFGQEAIQNIEHRKVKMYRLNTTELCVGRTYSFYFADMRKNLCHFDDFIALNSDTLKSTTKEIILSKMVHIVEPTYMNGEPSHFILYDKQTKHSVVVTLIPNPIEFTWEDNAHFFVECLTEDATYFSINGEGFKPHETIAFESISGNERIASNLSANANGKITAGISPAVVNQKGGKAKLVITRDNDQSAYLNYFWGTLAQENLQ